MNVLANILLEFYNLFAYMVQWNKREKILPLICWTCKKALILCWHRAGYVIKYFQRPEGITSCYLQYHLFLPGGIKQNKWPVFLTNGYNFNFSKGDCQIHPLCQIDLSSDLAHLPMDGTLQKHVGAFKGQNVTVWILSSIQHILAFCHSLTLKGTD